MNNDIANYILSTNISINDNIKENLLNSNFYLYCSKIQWTEFLIRKFYNKSLEIKLFITDRFYYKKYVQELYYKDNNDLIRYNIARAAVLKKHIKNELIKDKNILVREMALGAFSDG